MSDRSNERSIYIQPHSGGINDDPSSGDNGATMTFVDAWDLSLPDDITQLLEYQLQTGRARATQGKKGASGLTISFKYAAKGKASAAGSGTNMSSVALDFQSMLLANATQARSTTAGGTVGVGSTVNNLVVGTDIYNATDLAFVQAAGWLSSNRGAWARIASNTSPYNVNPPWEIAPPNAAIAYGIEQFRPGSGSNMGGTYLSANIVVGSMSIMALGGRVIAKKLVGQAQGIIYWEVTMRFHSWSEATRSAKPVASPSTLAELVCENSVVAIGDTRYEVSEFEFDLGITDRDVLATGAPQGRSNIYIPAYNPKLMFKPEYASAWLSAGANKSTFTAMLMCGAGTLSGGAVNTLAVWLERHQVTKAGLNDDQGIYRQQVDSNVVDPHYPAALPANTLGDYFIIGRA